MCIGANLEGFKYSLMMILNDDSFQMKLSTFPSRDFYILIIFPVPVDVENFLNEFFISFSKDEFKSKHVKLISIFFKNKLIF